MLVHRELDKEFIVYLQCGYCKKVFCTFMHPLDRDNKEVTCPYCNAARMVRR